MSRPLTLVTGGTRGIGAATARLLAERGHDLVLGYRHDDAAATATAGAVRGLGARCEVVAGDLTDPARVEDLFAVAARVGRLTGVVNNAGATLHMAALADTPPSVLETSVRVNLLAPLLVARAAVHALCDHGGVLVNISSAAATLGSPGEYVAYAAAKAGVDTLTLGLAQEVAGLGIRVVGVAPGVVRTGIHGDAGDDGRADRVGALVPWGRAGEPEEVAALVAWALGPEASYVTGTTLRVAGGR